MKKALISFLIIIVGLLLIVFKKNVVEMIIASQNNAWGIWGLNHGEREARFNEIFIIIFGIILILGALMYLFAIIK